MMSPPTSFNIPENSIICSTVVPPGLQPTGETRTDNGFVGHAARTARTTSNGKRARFARLPPNSSERLLLRGERKVENKKRVWIFNSTRIHNLVLHHLY